MEASHLNKSPLRVDTYNDWHHQPLYFWTPGLELAALSTHCAKVIETSVCGVVLGVLCWSPCSKGMARTTGYQRCNLGGEAYTWRNKDCIYWHNFWHDSYQVAPCRYWLRSSHVCFLRSLSNKYLYLLRMQSGFCILSNTLGNYVW